MNVFGKVLLFFIALAWAGFFVLAVMVLHTHKKYRDAYEAKKAELEAKTQWAAALAGHDEQTEALAPDFDRLKDQRITIPAAAPGQQPINLTVEQLKQRIAQKRGLIQALMALDKALIDRGRWWPNVKPQVNPQGVVTAQLPSPPNLNDPQDPNKRNTLFAFQAAQSYGDSVQTGQVGVNRARYVGEFNVTNVDQSTVTLEPAMPLNDAEKQVIMQMGGAPNGWNLYETMPTDAYAPLEGLTPQQLANLEIPASLLLMYQQHGTQTRRDDPPDRTFVLVEFNKSFNDLTPQQKQQLQAKEWMFQEADYVDALGERVRENPDDPNSPFRKINVAEIVKKGNRARFNLDTATMLTRMNVAGTPLAAEVPPRTGQDEGQYPREYWRPLFDFAQIFRRFYTQRPMLVHRTEELKSDNAALEKSLQDIGATTMTRQTLKDHISKEQERLEEEKQLVEEFQQELQTTTNSYAAAITALEQENQELVKELQRLQLERKRQLEDGIATAGGSAKAARPVAAPPR